MRPHLLHLCLLIALSSVVTIATGQSFEFRYTPPSLTIAYASPNFLWSVFNLHTATAYQYRLNIETGAKVDSVRFSIPYGTNNGRDIGWDGSNLWYSEWDVDSLYKINPTNGTVISRFKSPGSGPQGIAYGGGFLWHTDEYTKVVYKIDPTTGAVLSTLPVPETAGYFPGLEYWNGTLWLANYITRNIYQMSASASDKGRILNSYQVPSGTPVGITCDGNYVYFTVGNTTPSGVFRFPYPYSPPTHAVNSEASLPKGVFLDQNYPNPFNPSTIIRYELPKSSNVTLKIFNTLGQEVVTLVSERKDAGYYQTTWNANVPSGIYFYRLQAGAFVETKKMTLIR